ncbi:MAG: NAD-dependent deacylase [Candidatus Poseidoniaceae archaeon]|jgi:NAD-dependent deacetylase
MKINQLNIVVLTGAGISAESGLRTFRDNGGLWEEHPVEEVATPQAWQRNPSMVWGFYQSRRRQLSEVEPNPAHFALSKLAEYAKDFFLITQNVDDLHERSGIMDVVHMHGQLRMLRCELSGKSEERMEPSDLESDFQFCTCCETASRLRPDIVWFGEQPMNMVEIYNQIEACDVFIVVGSSGHVYPAAGLVNFAKQSNAQTILINLEEPLNSFMFDETHFGSAGKILPKLVNEWIEQSSL